MPQVSNSQPTLIIAEPGNTYAVSLTPSIANVVYDRVISLNGLSGDLNITSNTLSASASGNIIDIELNTGVANTWTAMQTFVVPGAGGNVFQFEVGNLGGDNFGLAHLNYYELSGTPNYLMAFAFIINSNNQALSPINVLTMNGNGNGSLQSAKNTLDDGSGNMSIVGAFNSNIAQTTITGTTAGSLIASMPEQGSSYKKVIVYANGYENNTTTAQTYTFPTSFTNTPVITTNSASIPGVTVSKTTLSIVP
ncbi:MAG: hypothetical protein ACP5MB_10385, partial [bacterium]